jgi:hypothetical protein
VCLSLIVVTAHCSPHTGEKTVYRGAPGAAVPQSWRHHNDFNAC